MTLRAIDGDLVGVSEVWRPILERLAWAQPGERQLLLDGYLAARPDRMEIVRSIANADPTATAPSDEEQRAWEQGGPGPRSEAVLLRASDVAPDHVDWLWPGRVPLGS